MEVADQAFLVRRTDGPHQARPLFERAYTLEYQAAQQTNKEPMRSVLHRSSATLALHGELIREAENAVALGLAGDPPPEIADELREVFEQINFRRHLSLRGIVLNPSELQMTLTGNAVSEGMALSDAIFNRVQNLEKLIIRTAQRVNNRPFVGRITNSEHYSTYMSVPRTGSFAVTLRVGQPEQEVFSTMDDRARIIDEVISNLDLVNEKRTDDLRNVIQDRNYYESFLGLVKNIAPDGDAVRLVGVTVLRNGAETSVGLSVKQRDIRPIISEFAEDVTSQEQEVREPVQITGELLFADAIRQKRVKIVDDNNRTHSIEVSEAIAEDVVRPYFGKRVTIDAVRLGSNRLLFRDINSIEG